MEKKSVSVRLEHITKRFKNTKGKEDVIAVHECNLHIAPGELITLLGPSGCGKTTTLRMIAGFELPNEGHIYIGNEDITMLPANKRDTATVFQSYGLFPHMSVFDNVAYGLKLRKIDTETIKKRVMDTLELVGLQELASRSPGKLSGGQQQRVALARCLIVEPSVLLLDEPLSNLDALLREQMRVEIRRIQKKSGITAVYVTHDRVEAMSLSDRVVVMKEGVIRQEGSPSDIYENPQSKFVAGFVGKVAFFPVEQVHLVHTAGKDLAGNCFFNGTEVKNIICAKNITESGKSVIMARPESLRLEKPNQGLLNGTVRTNVYLGHSIESFIDTEFGEILVQIDDPAEHTVFAEGDTVSINFASKLVRILPDDNA